MGLILVAIALIYAFYYKNKVLEQTTETEKGLSNEERLHVLVSEVFCPAIAGAIYYYGWKNRLPKKAGDANKYSFVALGIVIVLIVLNASIRGG